jgi:hypothetical protein
MCFFEPISLNIQNDIKHAEGKTVKEIFDSMTEEQKNVAYAMIGMVIEGEDDKMSQSDVMHVESSEGKTIGDIFESMTEEQKSVVYIMIAEAGASMSQSDEEPDEDEDEDEDKKLEDKKLEDEKDDSKNIDHSNKGGANMKNNVFDKTKDEKVKTGGTLTHDYFKAIMVEAKKSGSLKDAFLQHAVTYGIENIDYLFPDARSVNTSPTFIKRDMEWVQGVIDGTTHTPFSRIKSLAADVTAD